MMSHPVKQEAKLTEAGFNHRKSVLADVLTYLFFLGLTSVFLLTSPLHPWIRGESGTDSSVFRTMAMMMRYGYMPYRDSFDHKGPLIYFIDLFGDTLSKVWGIWVMEFAAIFVTMILIYRITSLWAIRRVPRIVCVLTAFTLLFVYYDGGNLVEEYAMPFIAAALLIFIDYMKNNRVSKIRLFLCGACFGCVCLLRANMAAIWLVFCIAIFIKALIQKQYVELGLFVFWFVFGVAVICAPILIWMKANGILRSFWNAYISFNLQYSSAEGGRALFPAKWTTFFTIPNTFACTLSIVSLCFLFYQNTKERFLYGTYLICFFINLYLISMSGVAYPHYGMILIPVVAAPLAGLFSYFMDCGPSGHMISVVIMGFFLCAIIIGDWEDVLKDAAEIYYDSENPHLSDTTAQLCSLVEEWTDEMEPISVYGNYDIIYAETKRPHATTFSYQIPIGDVEPAFLKKYWKQMKTEKPKVLILGGDVDNDKIQHFIEKNDYYLLWHSDSEILSESYRLYYRADFLKKEKGEVLDLSDRSKTELSHASIVSGQHAGTDGILCQGRMDRDYNDLLTVEESIFKGDYAGLKYTIDDISEEKVLTFYGKKTAVHGQPGVYIFDEDGNVLRECTDNYHVINDEWKLYMINVSDLKGRVTIAFNGGYTDNTGSPDSQYMFSNIRFYK